ncbi:MAG: penicillin-binding protein 2 [Dehalococcoidia bacterium]
MKYEFRDQGRRLGMSKIIAFRLAVFGLFGLLAIQLVNLQILKGESYETRAANNSVAIVTLPAERGVITDRNGVPLVENVPGYDAVAIPGRIRDDERRGIIFTLERLLDVPAQRLDRLISEGEQVSTFAPVILKENLTREEALALREMQPQMRGISLEVAANRRYLSGELLAPIVGYIGPINAEEYGEEGYEEYGLGDRLGRAGIENVYESYLRGDNGRKLIEQDALGRQLRLSREEQPVPGDSVVLALDYNLQTATATALRESMDTFSAPIGAAVAMDVNTGEILALVSLPSYDANLFAQGVTESQFEALQLDTEGRPLVNHAVSDAFPPGSVFKVVTGSAALDFGSITTETSIHSPGYLDVQDENSDEVDQHFRDTVQGTFQFPLGLGASSNVYFMCALAAKQPGSGNLDPGCGPDDFEGAGPANVARMARRFGLGSLTGIDLPGETSGIVPPGDRQSFENYGLDPNLWQEDPANPDDDIGNSDVDDGPLTNLSAWFEEITGFDNEPWFLGTSLQFAIGQNVVTTSPMQMAVVAAAIANGGNLLQPRMVHDVIDPDGNSRGFSLDSNGVAIPTGQPIGRGNLALDPRILAALRQGMHEAVISPFGTAGAAAIAGVEIAGKTGSPQIDETDPGTGKLRTHAWFIGFGPFENSEIAIAVYVQGGTGGEAAAPVARAMFEAYFSRVNVMRLP